MEAFAPQAHYTASQKEATKDIQRAKAIGKSLIKRAEEGHFDTRR